MSLRELAAREAARFAPVRMSRAGVDFPSAFDDEAPAGPPVVDAPEDVEALARVSDAALGRELMRRREARR